MNLLSQEFKNNKEIYNNVNSACSDIKVSNFLSAKQKMNFDIDKLNILESDKVILYKLKSQVNIETRNLKEAITNTNRCLDILNKDNNKLNPLLLSTNLDTLEANLPIANNINIIKSGIIEELAKAELIKDSYLITKAYNLLSICYAKGLNEHSALDIHKRAYALYETHKLTDQVLLYKIFNNNILDLSKIDKFIKKYKNSENRGLVYNLRFNRLLTLNESQLYSNLTDTEKLINDMENEGIVSITLAKCYFWKFLILELMQRDLISETSLNKSFEILNNYSNDSLAHVEFINFVAFNSVGKVKSYKLDRFVSNSYDQLFKKGLLYPNYNSLILNHNLIAKSINNPQEASKHYSNYIRLHNSYIGKESESLFDLNAFLKYNKMPVYEQYL
jgi:hypothetical protein